MSPVEHLNGSADSVLLRVDDVSAGYGSVSVLDRVSLTLSEGEAVTVLGPNGAGKTTLLRLISGVVPPRSGSVELVRSPVRRVTPHAVSRHGLAHVPEGRAIFPGLSVSDNLTLGTFGQSKKRTGDRDGHTLEGILELFPWMRDRLKQPGGTLSGGEQQMLAIARALMGDPDILLLDEPSLGLSPIMVGHVFETLAVIRSRGVSILLVEQNLKPALALADRGYVMNRGRMVLEGSSEMLAESDVFGAYLSVA
jgi:branched-chain amino acid transport system ATP-binding protein